MWLERRVVNCEVRVSRASVEAVDGGVSGIATWRVAVWLMRESVLYWYSLMWCCVRGSLKVNLRVVCGVCEGYKDSNRFHPALHVVSKFNFNFNMEMPRAYYPTPSKWSADCGKGAQHPQSSLRYSFMVYLTG
jgi:hypothetical protein